MAPSSIKLFTAWAAMHKQVVALEDRVLALRQEGGDAASLELELDATRTRAEAMLQEALAAFRSEMQERGLS